MASGPNPKQHEAIETTDGPVLIIAGPGTGKTFTLVERIVHLIQQKGVSPESLFVVTMPCFLTPADVGNLTKTAPPCVGFC